MKRFLLVLITLVMGTAGWSCDQCSVMLGSGVLSEGHYIGGQFRFRRQVIDSEATTGLGKHLDHFEERGLVKELYYAYEFIGNYHLKQNWHVTIGVPVVNNYRSIDNRTSVDIIGLGDPWFMVRNQKIWQRELGKTILSGGVGMKLPTGSVSRIYKGNRLDLDMQPGTGSMDFLFNVVLLYDYKRLFLMTQHTLKWNRTGAQEYRYGSSLASGLDFGIMLVNAKDKNWNFGLRSGPYMETMGGDTDHGDLVGRSSTQVFWNVGFQARYKRILASLQGQTDVYTDVDENIIPTSHRLITSLQYEF